MHSKRCQLRPGGLINGTITWEYAPIHLWSTQQNYSRGWLKSWFKKKKMFKNDLLYLFTHQYIIYFVFNQMPLHVSEQSDLFVGKSLSVLLSSLRYSLSYKWDTSLLVQSSYRTLNSPFRPFLGIHPDLTALLSGDHHKTEGLILLSSTKARTEIRGFLNVHVTHWNTAWFGFKCCFHRR